MLCGVIECVYSLCIYSYKHAITAQPVTDPWLNVDLLTIRQHTSASKGHEI